MARVGCTSRTTEDGGATRKQALPLHCWRGRAAALTRSSIGGSERGIYMRVRDVWRRVVTARTFVLGTFRGRG
jgi:hypothetical protein